MAVNDVNEDPAIRDGTGIGAGYRGT